MPNLLDSRDKGNTPRFPVAALAPGDCKECGQKINAERQRLWPNVVTCSPGCAQSRQQASGHYPDPYPDLPGQASERRPTAPDGTLELQFPIRMAPPTVRAHGLQAAHVRPRVGRKHDDGEMWSGQVPCSIAWGYPYYDVRDACFAWATMTFDCDDRESMESGLLSLPEPNWLTETKRGGHVTYTLAVPTLKHDAARQKPLLMLRRISEYFHVQLGADPAFSGLGRNPEHPSQTTQWMRKAPYRFNELAEPIPKGWRQPQRPRTAIGRNVDLFRVVCRLAGKFPDVPCLELAHQYNAPVADSLDKASLPDNEVQAIARHVEGYRAQWKRDGHKPAWIEDQRRRGRMGGLAGKGRPVRGEQRRSLFDDVTNEQARPWEAEGIKKRAWYYRQAKAKGLK